LLVEDNCINQQVALELLEQAGFKVTMAANGREALAAVGRSPFDCLLMDIQMPEMDGYEATRLIRADKRFEDLPILAMTANLLLDDRKKMYDAGMDGYIAKPIDSGQMLDAIHTAIYCSGAFTTRPDEDQPVNDETARNEHIVLDRKAGLANVNGNEGLYEKLLSEFCANHGRDGILVRQAVRDNDLETAHRIAHTLKGVAGTLGAAGLAETATDVDSRFKQGTLPDDDQLVDLGKRIDEVVKATGDSPADAGASSDTGETGEIAPDALRELRSLLEAMSPEAEERLVPLRPALTKLDSRLAEQLERQIGSFDFEAALASLDRVEHSLAT